MRTRQRPLSQGAVSSTPRSSRGGVVDRETRCLAALERRVGGVHISIWYGAASAGLRSGRIDGEFVATPLREREKSDMEIVVEDRKGTRSMLVWGICTREGRRRYRSLMLRNRLSGARELKVVRAAKRQGQAAVSTRRWPTRALSGAVKELAWGKARRGYADKDTHKRSSAVSTLHLEIRGALDLEGQLVRASPRR